MPLAVSLEPEAVVGVVTAGVLVVGLTWYSGSRYSRSARREAERMRSGSRAGTIRDITQEASAAYRAGDAPPRAIDAQGASTYELLRRYASRRMVEQRRHFTVSLIASVAGFAVIMVGVALAILTKNAVAGGIPVLAGAIVNGVVVLFHRQDQNIQRAVDQLTKTLEYQRNLDEALNLIHGVAVPSVRAGLQAAIAMHLSGIPSAEKLHGRILDYAEVAAQEALGEGQDAPTTPDEAPSFLRLLRQRLSARRSTTE